MTSSRRTPASPSRSDTQRRRPGLAAVFVTSICNGSRWNALTVGLCMPSRRYSRRMQQHELREAARPALSTAETPSSADIVGGRGRLANARSGNVSYWDEVDYYLPFKRAHSSASRHGRSTFSIGVSAFFGLGPKSASTEFAAGSPTIWTTCQLTLSDAHASDVTS